MSRAEGESRTGGRAPGDGWLLLVAAAGAVVVSSLSFFGADGLPSLLFGIVISVAPYGATFALGRRPVVSPRAKLALAGGLLIYLALDVRTRYVVFFVSTSSTAGVAILLMILLSVAIIPAGAALTYLVLRLFGPDDGAALK